MLPILTLRVFYLFISNTNFPNKNFGSLNYAIFQFNPFKQNNCTLRNEISRSLMSKSIRGLMPEVLLSFAMQDIKLLH